VKNQGGLEENIADTIAGGAPGTAGETVAKTLHAMKLIRIMGILERAGFAVELVNDKASTNRV
jgi:hypothetical protein